MRDRNRTGFLSCILPVPRASSLGRQRLSPHCAVCEIHHTAQWVLFKWRHYVFSFILSHSLAKRRRPPLQCEGRRCWGTTPTVLSSRKKHVSFCQEDQRLVTMVWWHVCYWDIVKLMISLHCCFLQTVIQGRLGWWIWVTAENCPHFKNTVFVF